MFDFENNDGNLILFSDTDTISFDKVYNTVLILQKNNKIDNIYLAKIGSISRSLVHNCDILYKNTFKVYAMSSSYASLKRINKDVLIDYIKDASTNTTTKFSYQYSMTMSKFSHQKSDNKYKPEHKNFIYGVDEYFLNHALNNYLIDSNIPYAIHTEWSVFSNIYWFLRLNNINLVPNEKKKLLNILFDYLLNETGYTNKTKLKFYDKYKFVDKHIYHNGKEGELFMYKLYEAFVYLKNNKLYKFIFPESNYFFLLSNEYFGVYDFEKIIFINSPYSDITIFSHKFPDDKIQKLKKIEEIANGMKTSYKIKNI
jgi:hypothetical protein